MSHRQTRENPTKWRLPVRPIWTGEGYRHLPALRAAGSFLPRERLMALRQTHMGIGVDGAAEFLPNAITQAEAGSNQSRCTGASASVRVLGSRGATVKSTEVEHRLV